MSFFKVLSGIGVLVGIALIIVSWRMHLGLSPGITLVVGIFVTFKEILDLIFAK